jgi:hypothetical protein
VIRRFRIELAEGNRETSKRLFEALQKFHRAYYFYQVATFVAEHQKSVNILQILVTNFNRIRMPKFSYVDMKNRRSGRLHPRDQTYPQPSQRQHRKTTSLDQPCSMDETDIQLRHEFNHTTAEASSEEEMTPPLALPLPQGPLGALRGYVPPLTNAKSTC